MLTVSLIVELLRTRPRLLFWTAALTQAFLWALVPSLFYSAPPDALPFTLATGHEFLLGSAAGPPLAFWAAELAYRAAGVVGVYLLAQACVVTAYWAVFRLGAAIVGPHHAALAVLLMVGISAFTLPTPDFGPAVAALPLWALALLHYWRAVGEGRGLSWFALAFDAGLLLLVTSDAPLLLALLLIFTVITRPGRTALSSAEPWLAAVVTLVMVVPYLAWRASAGDIVPPIPLPRSPTVALDWARLVGLVIAVHAGLAVLVVLAGTWPGARKPEGIAIARAPVTPFARAFVFCFAIAPALVVTALAALQGAAAPPGGIAPLVVLSGLAMVIAAGDAIVLRAQRIIGYAWLCVLIVPPLLNAASLVVLPWTVAAETTVAQPAAAFGRFFAETFERRTGTPLAVVAGEPRLAALVAMYAPGRPALRPEGSGEVAIKGAVVLWPAAAPTPTPPPGDIVARFPDLVPEVQAFERAIRGRLPPLNIGYGVIRPAAPQ